MTNGEKIKEIFPNMECEVKYHTVLTNIDNGVWFSLEWWNAEYKNDKVDCEHTDCNNCVNHKYCDYEPNKSEFSTGSTIKKCTTCVYREIDGKPHIKGDYFDGLKTD